MPVMKYTLDGVTWERIEGAPGPAGPTGPTGPAGQDGVDGATGPTGPAVEMPVGSVIMYGGNVAPEGWHLCNGTAHGSSALSLVIGSPLAPNLMDRFIVAAGASYAVGAVGGEATHVLSLAEIPNAVGQLVMHGSLSDIYGVSGVFANSAIATGYEQGSINPAATSASVVDFRLGGGGGAHENRPPYYALTYIIKK